MKHFIKIFLVAGIYIYMGSVSASVVVLRRHASAEKIAGSFKFLKKQDLGRGKKMSDSLCKILAFLFNGEYETALEILRERTSLGDLNDKEVTFLVNGICRKPCMPLIDQLLTFPRVSSDTSYVYSALKKAISLKDRERMLRYCQILVTCFCKTNEDATEAKRLFDNKLGYAFYEASQENEAALSAFQESIDWEASFKEFSQ